MKGYEMKKIIYILSLLVAFNATAKDKTVIAYGEGESYDWAVLSAVENAVRQTSNISIQGNGLHKLDVTATVTHDAKFEGEQNINHQVSANAHQRDGILSKSGKINGGEQINNQVKASANEVVTASLKDNSKDILAQYNGAVSSYEVLEHTEENGIHKVKISAVVPSYDAHDYQSKNLVKKAKYSLAIMPFKMTQKISCLGKGIDAKETNSTISNLFIEKLAPSRKFTLVDRNNLDDYAAEMSIIEGDMTLPENKVKLKNLAAADYILVGTIDNFSASTSKQYIPLTGETNYSSSSKLKISYRILEAATMEIISVGSVEQSFNKGGAFSSCANVRDLLFERAISEAAEKILTDIFPDYQPPKKAENKKAVKKSVPAAQPQDYSLPLY